MKKNYSLVERIRGGISRLFSEKFKFFLSLMLTRVAYTLLKVFKGTDFLWKEDAPFGVVF